MVRLVDLDDEDASCEEFPRYHGVEPAPVNDDRPNPNFSHRFSAALSCYP
jgi:hypothetical protein